MFKTACLTSEELRSHFLPNMGRPLSPDELFEIDSHIPAFVFDVFNSLIKTNWSGGSAVVTASEAMEKLRKHCVAPVTEWLDVERYYEFCGWKVEFFPKSPQQKPLFIFSRKY